MKEKKMVKQLGGKHRFLSALLAALLMGMPTRTTGSTPDNTKIKSKEHQTASHKLKSKKRIVEAAKPVLIPARQNLLKAAHAYQENANADTYLELWQDFSAAAAESAKKHVDPANLRKSCPILSSVGLKVIEAINSGANIKIYSFSLNKQYLQNKANSAGQQTGNSSGKQTISEATSTNRYALIQWLESGGLPSISADDYQTRSAKRSRSFHNLSKKAHLRNRKLRRTPTVICTQSIEVPANIEIKEACLFSSSVKENIAKNRFLAIRGVDIQSGHSWLYGLRHIRASWLNDPDLWQAVPTFLLQAGQAKARFSGNTLVINIGNQTSEIKLPAGGENPDVTGYEVSMPFINDRFALSGNEGQNPATAVAFQFLLALQNRRVDMAKIWLADPQLASIPGYLGLYSRTANSPSLKLIKMYSPLMGGSRFRLITSTKDDLIIDVGKVKTQWMIKALFIAPADHISREIGHILPATQTIGNGVKTN